MTLDMKYADIHCTIWWYLVFYLPIKWCPMDVVYCFWPEHTSLVTNTNQFEL